MSGETRRPRVTTQSRSGFGSGRAGTPNTLARTQDGAGQAASGQDRSTKGNPVQLHACPWCGTPRSTARTTRTGRSPAGSSSPAGNNACDFAGASRSTSSTRTSTTSDRRSSSRRSTSSRRMPWRDRVAAICSTSDRRSASARADRPGRAPSDLRAARHAGRASTRRRSTSFAPRVGSPQGHRIDGDDPARRRIRCRACSIARCVSSRRQGSTPATPTSRSRRPADERGDRLYVGVMAPGASHTTLMVRIYAALLQAAKDLDCERRGSRSVLDAARLLQQPSRPGWRPHAGAGRRRRPTGAHLRRRGTAIGREPHRDDQSRRVQQDSRAPRADGSPVP